MQTVRPLFVSSYPPEQSGLAAFTRDCADAVDQASRKAVSRVVAIGSTRTHGYDAARVVHVINNSRKDDAYGEAAALVNDSSCDVVSLQHDQGLYPGECGHRVLDFMQICRKPIVTTLHRLLTQPSPLARRVIRDMAAYSRSLVVMTETAARLLERVYHVERARVTVIPHGIPSVALQRGPKHTSARIICSVGLIRRGMGLEHMIQAMPRILAACPEAMYHIVGAAQPGAEDDREALLDLAQALGVASRVRIVHKFLAASGLVGYLQGCEVYVAPGMNSEEISSGPLAHAMAAGSAVVSTACAEAEEMLCEGRGRLVPFADSGALAAATLRFLNDSDFRTDTRERAHAYVQPMCWSSVGRTHLDALARALGAGTRMPTRPQFRGMVAPRWKRDEREMLHRHL